MGVSWIPLLAHQLHSKGYRDINVLFNWPGCSLRALTNPEGKLAKLYNSLTRVNECFINFELNFWPKPSSRTQDSFQLQCDGIVFSTFGQSKQQLSLEKVSTCMDILRILFLNQFCIAGHYETWLHCLQHYQQRSALTVCQLAHPVITERR